VVPKIKGHEHIITSDGAFFLEKLPKKVLIVGEFLLIIFLDLIFVN
jgi:pyruvate/2-oxoglutarate dehydrogenase complex dihydrolipoamide dehydrogenase (E3) component